MTANISKDAKTASIHLPAGRSAMAGVLSYPGIEHKDENDLSCYCFEGGKQSCWCNKIKS